MKLGPGDVVQYHLSASARECHKDADGSMVVARVVRLRPHEDVLDLHVEGSDLQKTQVPRGDGPGCWKPYEQPVEATEPSPPVAEAPKPRRR